jgi:AbrB family looped-hinge helix DNA binding protein
MSAVLKVQERGQVTLPKDVRDRLDIVPGSLLICTEIGNGVIQLTRVPKLSFDEMFGSWRSQPPTDAAEVEAEIRQAMKAAADEYLSRLSE